jgi:hypothetical protein
MMQAVHRPYGRLRGLVTGEPVETSRQALNRFKAQATGLAHTTGLHQADPTDTLAAGATRTAPTSTRSRYRDRQVETKLNPAIPDQDLRPRPGRARGGLAGGRSDRQRDGPGRRLRGGRPGRPGGPGRRRRATAGRPAGRRRRRPGRTVLQPDRRYRARRPGRCATTPARPACVRALTATRPGRPWGTSGAGERCGQVGPEPAHLAVRLALKLCGPGGSCVL